MYSLVSSSLLAIDLARHPRGAAVAYAVDRVLALTPEELRGLTHPAAKDVRERVEMTAAGPRMSLLLRGVSGTLVLGLPEAAASRTIVQALAETLMGSLTDLHDLLRREKPLCEATPEQAQVALDAVTAAWAGATALHDHAALTAAWERAVNPVPPALAGSSYRGELLDVLDEVSRRTPAQWTATARSQQGRPWSADMHVACWAAYDSGRLTQVARAQLAAARALRLSGASTGEDAHVTAMAVTAVVQAVCTHDVAPSATTQALRAAWDDGS